MFLVSYKFRYTLPKCNQEAPSTKTAALGKRGGSCHFYCLFRGG